MQVAHFLDAPALAWASALANALYASRDCSERAWKVVIDLPDHAAAAVLSSPAAQQLPLRRRLNDAAAKLHPAILHSCLTARPAYEEEWQLHTLEEVSFDQEALPPVEDGLRISWRDLAACAKCGSALTSITWLHLCPADSEGPELSPEDDPAGIGCAAQRCAPPGAGDQ